MGALENNHFLLRKLHSLTGLLPVGLFLLEHLYINSHSLNGPAEFNAAAAWVDSMPFLPLLELGILIPLFYHAFFGIWAALIAKNTLPRYNYPRNWAFYAQRISGFMILAFVLFHLWEFRWVRFVAQVTGHEVPAVTFSWVSEHMLNNAIFGVYLIAIIATVYHFANGMWAFCIDWGFTVGPKAQRVSFALWTVVFFAVSALGVGAAIGFRKPYPAEAASPTAVVAPAQTAPAAAH